MTGTTTGVTGTVDANDSEPAPVIASNVTPSDAGPNAPAPATAGPFQPVGQGYTVPSYSPSAPTQALMGESEIGGYNYLTGGLVSGIAAAVAPQPVGGISGTTQTAPAGQGTINSTVSSPVATPDPIEFLGYQPIRQVAVFNQLTSDKQMNFLKDLMQIDSNALREFLGQIDLSQLDPTVQAMIQEFLRPQPADSAEAPSSQPPTVSPAQNQNPPQGPATTTFGDTNPSQPIVASDTVPASSAPSGNG